MKKTMGERIVDQVPAYLLGQAQKSFHDETAVDHPLELMKDIAAAALAGGVAVGRCSH